MYVESSGSKVYYSVLVIRVRVLKVYKVVALMVPQGLRVYFFGSGSGSAGVLLRPSGVFFGLIIRRVPFYSLD